MPNWKLSPTVTEGMLKVCQNLTQRRINVAQTGFPLTRKDLELCAVGPELLAKFEDIASYGVASFKKDREYYFTLDPTVMPAVDRGVYLHALFTGEYMVYYLDDYQVNRYGTKWPLPLDRVPPEKLEALVKWTNNLVRETRMRDITQKTVKWFLLELPYRLNMAGEVPMITACHVMANWPALAMLVDGKPGDRNHRYVDHDWKIKFQSVPSNLDRWRTSHLEFAKKQSAIKLATMFLTSCEMLPTETPKEPVTATLEEWVRLPGDPD